VSLPIAHFADWYQSLLYVAPVVIVVAVLWALGRREDGDEVEPEG
jgi:hypothetical protein